MTEFEVHLSDAALEAIADQARYIAEVARSPGNSRQWLEAVWDAVDSLARLPRRGARAEEDGLVEYEVRQLVVGSHLLLFNVDDRRNVVWILGLRHGHRRPRSEDLDDGGRRGPGTEQ